MKLKILLFITFYSMIASAKLMVGTTTADLEAVVRAVGQDKVDTFSVAKGTQDPHQIEAKPSFMVKLRDTNLVVAHGLELEVAWLLPLIRGSRNSDIAPGKKGFLEVGQELNPIEVATGQLTRAEGDVHPEG